MASTKVARVPSPVGELELLATEAGLVGVRFETSRHAAPPPEDCEPDDGRGPAGETLTRVRHQLEEYFACRRTAFDLPLAPRGTPFQERVWRALLDIPYGTTSSYAAIARRIGAPDAARAVGAANGKNPIPIIVPCHRVVGAHGELTGFGGGIERKRWLLAHEASPELPLG
jgi:methylated-DNA-[protein]-cysteine S-methyltransferase